MADNKKDELGSVSERLADWQKLSDEVLTQQAVSQGAYIEGVKESDQNDPEQARKARELNAKEGEAHLKEREELTKKRVKEARAAREKDSKDAERS